MEEWEPKIEKQRTVQEMCTMLWQHVESVDAPPTGINLVNLEHARTGGGGGNGVPVRDHGETRGSRKRKRRTGNEQRFGRVGQPLGPLRIKAPLTLGGGGSLPIKERVPPWQTPEDGGGSSRGKVDDQEFPVLGTQRTARKVTGPADPDDTERDRRPCGHPIPASRDSDRGMRPAGNIRTFWEGNCNVRARGVQEPLASHLLPLADSFNPWPTSKE